MSNPVLLAGKAGIAEAGPLLLGVALVAGLLAIAVTVFRTALQRTEAGSRDDRATRLRALDEVVALGGMPPDEYAARRESVLNEA